MKTTRSITGKYRIIKTSCYSPVTHEDGAAAGGVVYAEARRITGGRVRIRHTAANGGRTASRTEDMDRTEFMAAFC